MKQSEDQALFIPGDPAHQSQVSFDQVSYGTQYTPNYSAAILELLVKAGYENDPRIEAGFRWLLGLRQRDGGWALPLRTVGKTFDRATLQADPIRPDTARPSSHLITGVVLRAFAAHAAYSRSREAQAAGAGLSSRLFAVDTSLIDALPALGRRFPTRAG